MCDYVIVRHTGILLRATKRIVFVPFLGPCVGIIELSCIVKVARYDVFVVTFLDIQLDPPLQ